MSTVAEQQSAAKKHVVIVGGGFAGLNCARKLASHSDVRITLVDKNNYQQFQPLLYQVATAILSPGNAAFALRNIFQSDSNVDSSELPGPANLADYFEEEARTVERAWRGWSKGRPSAAITLHQDFKFEVIASVAIHK